MVCDNNLHMDLLVHRTITPPVGATGPENAKIHLSNMGLYDSELLDLRWVYVESIRVLYIIPIIRLIGINPSKDYNTDVPPHVVPIGVFVLLYSNILIL